MHRQVGALRFDEDGLACRGVLVRHLVMPGMLEETAAIFEFLAEELSKGTYLNIMGQYRPAYRVGQVAEIGDGGRSVRFDEINRCPTHREIDAAYAAARAAGLWRFDVRRA